jgi:hypothetical protein
VTDDDVEKYKGDSGLVLKWLKEIELVKNSKAQKAFEKTGEKILKIYKNHAEKSDDPESPSKVMFNVLWSNVQVLCPSLYSRMPKIVVERRFKDSDPVGRLAAQVAERCTSFNLATQQDRFNYAVKAAVMERLLPGRGQVWVRYDAQFSPQVDENGEDCCDEDGTVIKQLEPNSERVVIDPLNWMDYFESPARNQYEVRWRSKRAFMTRQKLVERFGDIGKKVDLSHSPGGTTKNKKLSDEEAEFLLQAEVFEIWCSETKKVYWVSEGYKEGCLDVQEDTLRLKDFYPCPLPLLATTTTDSTYPTPDYRIYERLADELDYVTKRISSLVECIRFVGATAASFNEDVKNVLKLQDGELWPIQNWATWAEKGGFGGAMDWLPFDKCVAAIQPLMQYQEKLLIQIHEITGIPDIVRGASDPTETLGAQQQKAHWTVVKIAEKQGEVQRFCREIIAKMAEIIFEPGLFSDETIWLMAGGAQMPPEDQQLFQNALELLRSDRLRTFRVDIETDSTIAVDEDQDKKARMEYLGAINQVLGNIQNVMQFRPELVSPMIESALFATRAFRTGRPLEGAWEQALQQVEDNDAMAAQNPPPPPPDYEGQKLAIQSQELQLKGQELEMKNEIEGQKLQIEWAKVSDKQQAAMMDAQIEQVKQQFSQFVESQRLELEKYQSQMTLAEKLQEERRLAAENQIEGMKLQLEAAKLRGEAKESSNGNGHGGGATLNLKTNHPIVMAPPRKRRIIKMQRGPQGELVGESVELDEDGAN